MGVFSRIEKKKPLFRERLLLFVIISMILFPAHEISHIIAQLAFGVPVVITAHWYGISTNENIIPVLSSNPTGFYSIVLAGFIGTMIMMPFMKKIFLSGIFDGFEKRHGNGLYYIIFFLSALSIAIWDIVFFFQTLLS